ncbi:MAG: BREX-1 system phosphatase PglZ type B, partial [Thermovirgaceae bacterium]|nr:BREX-1 system phosphatase PglZ type B [Thermovirgaceae bacterium]
AFKEVELPEEAVPILYLPTVSRQDLRPGKDSPRQLQPLVELQYRGVCWAQKNGRDWTVEAFLGSREGGLGLDLAKDSATRSAMMTVLGRLMETPTEKLRGKRLEAEDFYKLEVDDPDRDVLAWLSDPEGTQENWSEAKWRSFCSSCKSDLGLDPVKDGPISGAEKLGKRQDEWSNVWERFAESPALYPGIGELLEQAMPAEMDLFEDPSSWPGKNDAMEKELRGKLLALGDTPAHVAREEVLSLEKSHGMRRTWVWAKIGKAPLAHTLSHLKELAEVTGNYLPGASVSEMADRFASEGWKADAAAVQALASVKSSEDKKAIAAAVRAIYLPWLDQTASKLQEHIREDPTSARDQGGVEYGNKQGEIILFFDALRLDVGNRVAAKLRAGGYQVQLKVRWAGFPTVTATSKLALTPIAGDLKGGSSTDDFLPQFAESQEKVSTYRFQKVMKDKGLQFINSGETGDPGGLGWTEYGDLDKLGHSLQGKLAANVEGQVDLLVERIQELLGEGWKEVNVITDHGWLLLPGGLPSVKLPKYLTETRWLRCAAVKGESKVDVPTVPWHWNPDVPIAVGPGVSCFIKGSEYAHGGISLQECVIPHISVTAGTEKGPHIASIEEIRWAGLRCRVTVSPPESELKVDLRTSVNDPASSISGARSLETGGTVGLLVENDDLEGTPAILVILDAAGQVISKKPTIVGGEE